MASSEYFEVLKTAVTISFAEIISKHDLRVRNYPGSLSVVLESDLCKLTITLDVDNVFAVIEPGPEADTTSLYDRPLAVGLSHIIRAEHPEIAAALTPFRISPRRIRERVALLAETVSAHASQFLRGDFSAWQVSEFEGLKSSRKPDALEEQKAEEWRRERRTDEIRRMADEAWKGGRYGEVITLYESILSQLTPSESMKLSLARKRVG